MQKVVSAKTSERKPGQRSFACQKGACVSGFGIPFFPGVVVAVTGTNGKQKIDFQGLEAAAGSGEPLGGVASNRPPGLTGARECRPYGKLVDSSQSANKFNSKPVKPRLDRRTKESCFGDVSVTAVPQFPSLAGATFSHCKL